MKITLSDSLDLQLDNCKVVDFNDLKLRIEYPARSIETMAEYSFETPEKRREMKLKDGGFYPSLFDKKGEFRSSSLLALNIENAGTDFFEYCRSLPFKYYLYTTRSYTPENPKFRLIIPFNRPIVDKAKYPIIAQSVVMEYLKMEWVDPESFRPDRIVFNPTVCDDGIYEYYCEEKRPFLNIDLLSFTEKQERMILKPIGNELLIGPEKIFCRHRMVSDVLEDSLMYEKVDNNHWRFTGSYGTGNMYVYNDNRHCVPLSELDPSYAYCQKKKKALTAYELELYIQHGGDKAKLNSYVLQTWPEANQEWTNKLKRNKKSQAVINDITNYTLILENDPALRNFARYNKMTGRLEKQGEFLGIRLNPRRPEWTDEEEDELIFYLSESYRLTDEKNVHRAVNIVGNRHKFHPLLEEIENVEWDGEDRIETFYHDYHGMEDTAFNRKLCKKFAVGAIMRLVDPGCKFDTMLVLYGPQGAGKSYSCRKLAGDRYFTELDTFNGKEAKESLMGKWIVEVAEMDAYNRANTTTSKNFITKQDDYFRQAYRKNAQTFLRSNVFIGTTNKETFLKDITGNRRYWPIACLGKPTKDIFTDFTKEERLQYWAEALYYYNEGYSPILNAAEEEELVELQQSYTQEDELVEEIRDYLSMDIDDSYFEMDSEDRLVQYETYKKTRQPNGNTPRDFVTIKEIYQVVMGRVGENPPVPAQRRIADALLVLGWKSAKCNKRWDKYYGSYRIYTKDGKLPRGRS